MMRRVEDRIVLAHDRNKWRDVVNTEMNLWVPYNMGDFWTSKEILVCREERSSMELTAVSYRIYPSPRVLLHTAKWKVLGSRMYVCLSRCAVFLWVQ
jgi:hypothetical protein